VKRSSGESARRPVAAKSNHAERRTNVRMSIIITTNSDRSARRDLA
jgi:hypothetical protein